MKQVNRLKRGRIAGIVLSAVIILLCAALAISFVVIDKLNKNNLFSKSIFLDNDYFLGSVANNDFGQGSDGQNELPAGGDIEAAVNEVMSQLDDYFGFEALWRPGDVEAGAAYEQDAIKNEHAYQASNVFEDGYVFEYAEGDEKEYMIKDIYSAVESFSYETFINYGVCRRAREEISTFTEKEFGIRITFEADETKIIDVPYVTQEGVLPNGCESVSAVMLMKYAGCDISPTEFVDKYLKCEPVTIKWGCRYGPNPKLAYAGDPYSEKNGYGCYAPVIADALNKALESGYYSRNISGLTLESICKLYIDEGIPVAVWVTLNMDEIDKLIQWQAQDGSQSYLYPANEHCMVLCGYDGESYYFNDPYGSRGLTAYPKDDCVLSYNSLGMQAVAVIPLNSGSR